MSKTLSDTVAIAGKHVCVTANPDYSGFRSAEYGRPQREACVGKERPAHAVQVLKAQKPGAGK